MILSKPIAGWRQRRGSATVVVLIFVGIMATLVAANGVALKQLKREMKLIEERQQRYLNGLPRQPQVAVTNQAPSELHRAPK